MVGNAKNLFMCLLTVCLFFGKNSVFKVFPVSDLTCDVIANTFLE